jgi:hexosaminidase
VPDTLDRSDPGLLPRPDEISRTGRSLRLASAHVETDVSLTAAARWWGAETERAFGTDVRDGSVPVRFRVDDARPAGGFGLRVDDDGVLVSAADLAGAHAAAQALRQLAGPRAFRRAPVSPEPPALPHVVVEDHPHHAWRGVLLDVARHFLPKHDVLRFVDLAAAHRLNVVQLHLTDDQGWRFESRRHPRLTEVGAWRRESTVGTWRAGVLDGRPHGGFYTADDLREIVSYARERGVTVVPEIDVPGHVEAAVAAYPRLGSRTHRDSGDEPSVRTTWGVSTDVLDPSPASLAFFRDVLDEVMDVFDSPYVALGGDEVPTLLWRENPEIVARARELGLDDVSALHGWFLASLCEHVHAAGRRPVVWDEAFRPGPDGASNLPTGTIVTAWRGWTVGARAMAAGHDVVMAPEQVTYLDHRASDGADEPVPVGFVTTVRDVYTFDPMPSAALAEAGLSPTDPTPGRLLGAQAQLWTEHLDSARRVDYAAFPRLAAFAEAVWSTERDAPDAFLARLERSHLPRLDAYGVEYRPPAGPHPWQTRPGVAGFPRDRDAELAAGGFGGVGGWVEE